jgi:hypothetical protein
MVGREVFILVTNSLLRIFNLNDMYCAQLRVLRPLVNLVGSSSHLEGVSFTLTEHVQLTPMPWRLLSLTAMLLSLPAPSESESLRAALCPRVR